MAFLSVCMLQVLHTRGTLLLHGFLITLEHQADYTSTCTLHSGRCMPIASIRMLHKLAFFALLALVACAAECSPARHRRPAKFFRSDTNIDKGPQVTSRQWHGSNTDGGLQDLTGVYAGTWKRLDWLSDAADQPAGATSYSSSSSSSSSSGYDSQLPPVLTSSSSGRIMLRLTAGPTATGEELGTIEGVLRLSEGSLVFGPGVKHLDVSGITKLGPDGVQALQAVAKPQHTVYNTGSSSSSSVEGDSAIPGNSRLTGGWIRGRHQRQHQRQPQQHAAQEQGWLRGHKLLRLLHSKNRHRPLGLQVDSSGTLGGSSSSHSGTFVSGSSSGSSSSSVYTTSSDAGNDLYSEATPHRRLTEQDSGLGVSCRFRLELAVTQGNTGGSDAVFLSTAGASRAIKAAAEPPQVMAEQQQEQLHQQEQQLDPGDGEVVSDESSSGFFALYNTRWQHVAGLGHLMGQQQHQQQQSVTSNARYRGLKSLSISGPNSASGAAADLLAALQPALQSPGAAPTLTAAAAASVAVAAAAAEYVVRTAEEAVDQRSGSAVTAAESLSTDSSEVSEVDEPQLPAVDVAAAAALKAATAKSATAEEKWGSTSSSRGLPVRSLQSRDFPGLPEASAVSNGKGEAVQIESQSISATAADAAAAQAPDEAELQQHRMIIAEGDQQADDLTQQQSQSTPQQSQQQQASSSSSSPVPQSLIDYWMLPCSHPQQLHNLRCHYQRHQQHYWRQHMVIQGVLLSDNCNASWSITAVALAPGGLERQAMCYAIVALLLCLAQVVLLRRQAKVVQASPAAALKMSLLGVCAGSQLDACLSLAHLAAALAAPDVSLPLLVVAAAQFALFAGTDMTLLLHVWRAHTSNSRRQQQRQQQPLEQGLDLFNSSSGSAAPLQASIPSVSGDAASTLAGFHPQHWSAAVAAAASAVAAQLQEQAEGLRELAGSSSGSSLIDVLLSGMVQLLTGQTLVLLYVRFYLVLLAVTLISWVLASQIPLLLLLAYSFWLPQITYNILHSTRQAVVPAYIIAASTARVLLPVYLLSCPGNMLQLAPQSWLAVGLVVWLGLQVLLLLLQHYVGPHVCVPAAWVPERYNYHRHELPWQFKQQIAELRKLGYTQQQQQQVLIQPSSAATSDEVCRCTGCSSSGFSQPTPAAAPLVTSCQQQQWPCVTGPAVPDSAASCCCQCSCGAAPSNLRAAAAARRRDSDSSSNSCWGSFSGDSSSSSSNDWEVTQQQHSARASWPAVAGPSVGMPSSSNQNTWQHHHHHQHHRQQQHQRMTWYPEINPSSDAYYITVLGATATLAAAGTAQQHTPRAVTAEPHYLSYHTHSPLHHSTSHQHYHHASRICPTHQVTTPSAASFLAPSTPAAAAAAHVAGSGVSILSGQHSTTTTCCQAGGSYQSWLNQADDVFHDVMEGYDALTGQGVVECVICMAGVELLPVSGRCVTPCGHFFHPECLASWMEVKAECPTCRGPLPPL